MKSFFKRLCRALVELLNLDGRQESTQPSPVAVDNQKTAANQPLNFPARELHFAFHEAGHVAMALLHRDVFEVKEVTISQERADQLQQGNRGLSQILWSDGAMRERTNDELDKRLQSLYGGICSATINRHGLQHFSVLVASGNLRANGNIVYAGADRDVELAAKCFVPLAEKFNLDYLQVTRSTEDFCFRFMTHDGVWKCIQDLAIRLISHPAQTLTETEIHAIMQDNGFFDLVDNVFRPAVFPSRYPLTRASLLA